MASTVPTIDFIPCLHDRIVSFGLQKVSLYLSGWFQPMQFNPAFFIELAASINIRQQILRLAVQNDGISCRYGQVTTQALMVLRGFFPKKIRV